MTTEEYIEYWLTLSNEDLKVGETLLKNQHYLYAGFMCHQVIERCNQFFEQTKQLQQWIKETILSKK